MHYPTTLFACLVATLLAFNNVETMRLLFQSTRIIDVKVWPEPIANIARNNANQLALPKLSLAKAGSKLCVVRYGWYAQLPASKPCTNL